MPKPTVTTIEELDRLIQCHPLIDNHAHPLLLPSNVSHYPLETITCEAHGPALEDTTESLAHMRAVKYLASYLNCPDDWDAIKKRRASIDAEEWNRRCFQGVQCVLMDDGLDKDTVESYKAHDRLTTSPTKRIVRIEKVAEDLLLKQQRLQSYRTKPVYEQLDMWQEAWIAEMEAAIADPEVAGFKSVICYRSGLDIDMEVAGSAEILNAFAELLASIQTGDRACRIDNKVLNDQLVRTMCSMLQASPDEQRKPIQFHTGLGDSDIQLLKANPAHLEPVLRKYSKVPIVLLHSSYPYTREAGYLATVYKNAYLDFGEVFPMLSRDGQKSIIKEMLEQTPGTKLLWSSDGHWFPETFILANAQIRDVLSEVLIKRVKRGDLTLQQATRLTENMFFENSNRLYKLGLSPTFPTSSSPPPRYKSPEVLTNGITPVPPPPEYETTGMDALTSFLDLHPRTRFVQFIWTDYTALRRLRVLPITSLKRMLERGTNISITKAAFSLLQNDYPSADSSATGMYDIIPDWSSLRTCDGYSPGHASVQCFVRLDPKTDTPICPRAALSRAVKRAADHGMEFLVGFETEVTLFNDKDGSYELLENAHAWSASFALTPRKTQCLDEIATSLEASGIELLMYHPEACAGQYEFVTGPLPPHQAVDALLHTRETIEKIAAKHKMRATLHPKPVVNMTGNAAHCHISLSRGRQHEGAFFSGVLKHLRAISCLGMPTDVSYQRLQDNCWAGGTWITWGEQNREAPLRRISAEDAHWEIRGIDGTANAFLFLAGVIFAGCNGVEEGLRLPVSCEGNPAQLDEAERKKYGLTARIPRTLKEALEAFVEDKQLAQLLGKEVAEKFRLIKEAEMAFVSKLDITHGQEGWKWFLERY